MKKGIFRKYIVAFASFFLVPLLILAFCLQFILFSNLEKEIQVYNTNILERLGDDMSTVNGRLLETCNTLSFGDAMMSDFTKTSGKIQMLKELLDENTNNPYTSKIYFIYNGGEISFSSSGVYSMEDLLSKQMGLSRDAAERFRKDIAHIQKPEYSTEKKSYRTSKKEFTKDMLLYVYPVAIYGGDASSWLILELNMPKMLARLSVAPGNYSNGIFVMNGRREILLSDGLIEEAAAYKEEIEEAADRKSSGIYTLGGRQKLIVYPLEKTDLILGNIIAVPNLLTSILGQHITLVTGVFIMVLIGCGMAIYMAYRYYRPIYQLSQYMKQENDTEPVTDEFDYMKNQYDRLNHARKSLADELERQWPLVEERLVTELLYEGRDTWEDKDLLNSIVKGQMDYKNYMVAVITESGKKEQKQIYNLYKEKDKEMKAYFSKDYMVFSTFLFYYDAIAVIVCGEALDQQDVCEAVYEGLKRHCAQYIINPVIGYGKPCHELSGIHVSFLEALANIKVKLTNPQRKIGFEIPEGNTARVYEEQVTIYQTENILVLSRCIDTGSAEDIQKIVSDIVLNMEDLPGHMALMCCYDIVNHLVKEFQKKNIQVDEFEIYELTTFRSAEEFGEKLQQFLQKICETVSSSAKSSKQDLARRVREYIDENYRNPNLSLVSMAEDFRFSPSYLSKFIAQNLNESFTDMITRKRISYTKEALVNTNKQIAQIAQEAGYLNISNFTRRFKNLEKMTPGQYRSLYGKSV